MSRPLPQEILDLIIDHLHEPTTLNTCCLVSKSWVPRARKYLFVRIKLNPLGRHLKQWRETFPDPTNSPAHNTRTLVICHPMLITAAPAETLLTFCGVVHLDVDTDLLNDRAVSLVPLLGFSPATRSLRLTFASLPNSTIFNLACSFPLLEDLALISRARRLRHVAWSSTSTSPRFTGSLELRLMEGIYPTVLLLLDLPNGLHFTAIAVPWFSDRDVESTMDLVSRCSDTLGSLTITNCLSDQSQASLIDLSKATKLQEVVFGCKTSNARWIDAALRTVQSEHIQQITLDMSRHVFWGGSHQEWSDLDSLLDQFWTSHSVRLKIKYESTGWLMDERERLGSLLPQLSRRGIVDMVEYPYVHEAFPSFVRF